ncbi:S24 family peptidase [Chryseobacterium joostei]|nr:S24 family peptidase [Chryseobacterium joostei]
MNKKLQPPDNFITTIENKLDINLSDFADYTIESNLKPKTYPSHIEVRLVTNKARAGYTDSYYADDYLKDLPVVLVEADKEYKGKYMAFEIDGDSMEPYYYSGDIVIGREIKRDLWQYKLHYKDYDFIIAHGTKGIMLKEITNHNVETGEIVCHSLNTDGKYKDFTLNLHEVSFLYNVVEHRTSGRTKRINR